MRNLFSRFPRIPFVTGFIMLVVALTFSSFGVMTALSASQAAVVVPNKIGFEGYLAANANGDPLADGTYSLAFTVYNSDTGQAVSGCAETQSVVVTKGLYAVTLNLGASCFDGNREIGVKVNGGTEITPRTKVASVPFALNANKANSAENVAWTGVSGTNGLNSLACASGQTPVWNGSAWVCQTVGTTSGDGGIRTKAWDMAQCASSGYCSGNTDSVVQNIGDGWFPGAFQAKIEVDYGQTINVARNQILIHWHWDGSFTQDCKAAVYSSLDGANWTTITDTLSQSIKTPWGSAGSGGWGMVRPLGAFRYLRVHIGAGIAGQNCGWVGFERLRLGFMNDSLGSITQYGSIGSSDTEINYFGSRTAIRTTDVSTYSLAIGGAAIASDGWHTGNADYAEWFEKEAETQPGDLVGLNLETGKVRRYQPGDKFIGIHSAAPGFVGNQTMLAVDEMRQTHTLVGLLGQLDFDPTQVNVTGRRVTTLDGQEIGVLLNNGKVLLGR